MLCREGSLTCCTNIEAKWAAAERTGCSVHCSHQLSPSVCTGSHITRTEQICVPAKEWKALRHFTHSAAFILLRQKLLTEIIFLNKHIKSVSIYIHIYKYMIWSPRHFQWNDLAVTLFLPSWGYWECIHLSQIWRCEDSICRCEHLMLSLIFRHWDKLLSTLRKCSANL